MNGPKSLDEREERLWRAFRAMRRSLDRAIEGQLTVAGGSSADYELLVAPCEAPDRRLRARELGRQLDWDRSRLSHQLRRMQRRGLVVRHECENDARGTMITMTREGAHVVRVAEPGHVATVRARFVDLLSADEIDTLTDVATRVLGHQDVSRRSP